MPGSTTLVKTVFPPENSYPDKGGAGSPEQNHFYIVRAKCGALWGDSGRAGAFNFLLTPGN
jgi:hypothetical protein